MKAWDAARVASRRELPRPRKMLGPVGEPKPGNEGVERCYARGFGRDKGNASTFFAPGQCSTCKHCGFHVCSCPIGTGPGPVGNPGAEGGPGLGALALSASTLGDPGSRHSAEVADQVRKSLADHFAKQFEIMVTFTP